MRSVNGNEFRIDRFNPDAIDSIESAKQWAQDHDARSTEEFDRKGSEIDDVREGLDELKWKVNAYLIFGVTTAVLTVAVLIRIFTAFY